VYLRVTVLLYATPSDLSEVRGGGAERENDVCRSVGNQARSQWTTRTAEAVKNSNRIGGDGGNRSSR
jgi:hypothetical protein